MQAASARYRILRRLGHGGMAEVFEAELAGELGFVRKVAIKRMLADAATDPASAQRFLDEARIASKLHHANIVSVLDVGLLDGLPFQVLELVDGIDASRLQARSGGTLPLDIALIIANDVAHALDHAHTALDANRLPLGIVHRDVKPANVLVAWTGDVKLTDFGIAIAIDRAARTESGQVIGTQGFLAPEQRARGELDGRTDVFSLGLTLHALVAGYTPLREITVEMAVLDGAPLPIDPAIPDDVRALIARACAPVRRDRATAGQLAEAIGSALAKRLDREPRGALRAFLAPLHEQRPKPGALDQLLGLDVVVTGDTPLAASAADQPKRYELRSTDIATAASPTKRKPRRRIVAVGALAALAAGGIAYVATFRGGSNRSADDAQLVAMASSDAKVIVEPTTGDAALAAPPTDAALADAAPAPADAAPGTRHHGHAKPDAGAGEPPPPKGNGWLQIVGDDIGAQVIVDGKQLGYTPDKLQAPYGKHQLVLKRPDGTTTPARTIEITEYNDFAHPAH